MTYEYRLSAQIPADPPAIYSAWLESAAHSGMTGGVADMSGVVGGSYSAWDGYIRGVNLELDPSSRIVQSWRTADFAESDPDSIITVTLESTGIQTTQLTLHHAQVPDDQTSYEQGGWQDYYFTPMIAYFSFHTDNP